MDESSQRELLELRALLAKHGPAAVLSTVGTLCAEEAKNPAVTDVELWEVAADAATSAATSLLEGDELEGDDDEDPEAEMDEGEDSEEGEEESEEGEATNEAPAETAAPEETTTDDAAEAAPRSQERGRTMTIKDQRLGKPHPNTTHWRCFRIDETGKWNDLALDERGDGILTNEWPIKTCSAEAIAEHWGDGQYIVSYVRTDETGRRRPAGRSRTLRVEGGRRPAPTIAELNAAFEPLPGRSFAPPPVPPAPVVVTMPAPAAQAAPGATIDPWAMITYLREADDRAQARASQMAQVEIQRLHMETKDREARWRAENELQMERERLASKERIAQMEHQAKAAGRSRGVDPELTAQLGQVLEKFSKMEERVEELEDYEDEDEYVAVPANAAPAPAAAPVVAAAPPPPADPMQELFTQLVPHLGPMAHTLLAKFMEGRPPLSIPDGVSFPGPKDPSKKPN
jgi:flagellum-specific peptidoglycan hydrolase FlgJ